MFDGIPIKDGITWATIDFGGGFPDEAIRLLPCMGHASQGRLGAMLVHVGSSACYAGREVAIKMSASHLKLERSDMIHASSHCIQSDEEGIKVLFFCPVNILFSICRKTKQQASSQYPLKPVCQKV